MTPIQQFSHLALELMRSADRIAPSEFRDWAFRLLKDLVAFDSALWAHAALVQDVLVTQDLQLHNQPVALMEDYAQWNKDDIVLETILCNPNRCVLWHELEDLATRQKTAMYWQYERKYGLEDAASIMIPFGRSGLQFVLSLYRSDADRPFSNDDREMVQAVAPLLLEAHNQVAMRDVRQRYDLGGTEPAAVVTVEGRLVMADIGFVEHIEAAWPDWQPPQLPERIVMAMQRAQRREQAVNGLLVRSKPVPDGHVVMVRPVSRLDVLSTREHEIAAKIAEGLPYKRIASELGISAKTVANHLRNLNTKLGVTSRNELLQMLRDDAT